MSVPPGIVAHLRSTSEVGELVTESYCLQVPKALAEQIHRPPPNEP
jgi:hypothetical protein